MDGNNRPDQGNRFVKSNDPDFYIPQRKRPQTSSDDARNRQAAPAKKSTAKKPAKRKNSKPSYAGNKGVSRSGGNGGTAGQNRSRQPYGNSGRYSAMDEKQRQYMMYQLRKKQVMRNRMIAGTILAVLIISAVVCTLSLTVLFPIKNFVVNTNDSAYSVEEIKKASKITFDSDNLLRCDLVSVAKNIETSLPYIGKVYVDRKLPHTIVVDVEKTAAVAAVEHGRFVLLVNEEGKILQEVVEVPFGLRLVKYGELSQTALGETIASKNGVPVSVYVTLTKSMRENGLNDITVIDISDPDSIVLNYQDRIEIKLGRAEDINVKIGTAVKAIAEEESKYGTSQRGTLDFTYGLDRCHFIPYVEKAESTEVTEETTVTSVFDSPLKSADDEEDGDGEDKDEDEEKTTKKKTEKKTEKETEKKTEKETEKKTEKETEKKTEKNEDASGSENSDNNENKQENSDEN